MEHTIDGNTLIWYTDKNTIKKAIGLSWYAITVKEENFERFIVLGMIDRLFHVEHVKLIYKKDNINLSTHGKVVNITKQDERKTVTNSYTRKNYVFTSVIIEIEKLEVLSESKELIK